jgi:hypothetical protein
MMEAGSSVNIYQTTRRNIPEDSHCHFRRRENLKSFLQIFHVRLAHSVFKTQRGIKTNSNYIRLLYQELQSRTITVNTHNIYVYVTSVNKT